jgi:hypothetical protein
MSSTIILFQATQRLFTGSFGSSLPSGKSKTTWRALESKKNDQMYDDAMAAIGEHLLMRTPTSKIVHTGELQPTRAGGYQQRLVFQYRYSGFLLAKHYPGIGNWFPSKTI